MSEAKATQPLEELDFEAELAALVSCPAISAMCLFL